jgi:hypothetical protein
VWYKIHAIGSRILYEIESFMDRLKISRRWNYVPSERHAPRRPAGRDRLWYIFGQISNKIPLKLQYKHKNINKQLRKNEIGKKIKK